jgi:anti-sigma B factor antagonist
MVKHPPAIPAGRERNIHSNAEDLAMKIAERQSGDITILDVQGKLLLGEGDEIFREAVKRVVEGGRLNLVINMAEVPYVDSSGISELVRTYVTLGKRGGRMTLVSLTRRVHELLSVTRLLTVFEAFDSEEEAVDSYGRTATR